MTKCFWEQFPFVHFNNLNKTVKARTSNDLLQDSDQGRGERGGGEGVLVNSGLEVHPVYVLGHVPPRFLSCVIEDSLETWFPYDYCNHWKMFTNCLGIFPSAVHNERTVSFDGCVTSFPISYTMLHSQHFFQISELKLSHQWLTHSMEVNYNNTVVIFLTC